MTQTKAATKTRAAEAEPANQLLWAMVLAVVLLVGTAAFATAGFLLVRANGGFEHLSRRFGIGHTEKSTPAYLAKVAQHQDTPILPDETIFIGDSLTESQAWNLVFRGLPVRNFGIGGDQSLDVLNRIETITERQPAQVFLMVGTNDVGCEINHGVTVRNVRKIIEKIQAAHPACEIHLMAVPPSHVPGHVEKIDHLNEAYAELAFEYECDWIDFHDRLSAENGQLAEAYSLDGVHLNEAGYDLWLTEIDARVIGTDAYALRNAR